MKKRVSGKGRELIGGKGSKHSHSALCVCMKLLKSKKLQDFFKKDLESWEQTESIWHYGGGVVIRLWGPKAKLLECENGNLS